MNFKKIILVMLVFLAFVGTGAMLSNVQSKEADQLLQSHGMSNNSRYFYTKDKQSVKSLLQYLNKHFNKYKIQLHLENRKQDQVLVWTNHKLVLLPTNNGRYFDSNDFSGKVSFAVLGPENKVKVLQTQGNKYILYKNRYYSVIGVLKDYQQNEQRKYYLSTGVDQPTAHNYLDNYRILIDAPSQVINKVAKHYHAKLYIPDFVQFHQSYRFSIIREFLMIILFWLIVMISNALLALMQLKQARFTHLHGTLLRNWIINHSLRLILLEGILGVGAYIFLIWRAFFKRTDHLILLLVIGWFLAVGVYIATWLYLHRKEKQDHA